MLKRNKYGVPFVEIHYITLDYPHNQIIRISPRAGIQFGWGKDDSSTHNLSRGVCEVTIGKASEKQLAYVLTLLKDLPEVGGVIDLIVLKSQLDSIVQDSTLVTSAVENIAAAST